MNDKSKMFPVMDGKTIKQFPLRFLDEEQAMINHSQTLERLAERGGLVVAEIYANYHKLQFTDGSDLGAGWVSNISRRYPFGYQSEFVETICEIAKAGWNPITLKPERMGFYYVSCIRQPDVLAYAYWNGTCWEPVRGGPTKLGFDLWKGEGQQDRPIEVAK